MNRFFLQTYPSPDEIKKSLAKKSFPAYREANGHIHTPYSFSAFSDVRNIFSMANEENIALLGINDFFVTDGYEAFHNSALESRVFPLFNIEFIGLMKEEQKRGIRINDPNNPGRIYFSGKGLDYPFNPGFLNKLKVKKVIDESQNQIRAMITKLNELLRNIDPELKLSYETVKKNYAFELVRERHLAKAVRVLASERNNDPEAKLRFIESLYCGKKSKAGIENHSALENEIRSNLLKSGGAAFVEEDEKSFLELEKIISIIVKAGGIPCYPVLLDDQSGRYTEFESDPERLYSSLAKLNIGCIELIPGRNDGGNLKRFVEFFDKKGFAIMFGTEHNTPEMIPLKVTSRGSAELDEGLKKTGWDGVCLVAAHQYLRAQGRQGFILPDGKPSLEQKENLSLLGHMIIEYFLLNKQSNEAGNK